MLLRPDKRLLLRVVAFSALHELGSVRPSGEKTEQVVAGWEGRIVAGVGYMAEHSTDQGYGRQLSRSQ